MRIVRPSLLELATRDHSPGMASQFRRSAARRCQRQERRSRKKVLGIRRAMIPDSFVGEESKKSIVQNRATHRTAEVVEPGVVPYGIEHAFDAAPGESIEPRAICFEKSAAMILVRAVLRNDLDLCPRVTTVLRVIAIADDFHFLHRIFVGRDHGGSRPRDAGDTNAVQLNVVQLSASAARGNLWAILGRKHST